MMIKIVTLIMNIFIIGYVFRMGPELSRLMGKSELIKRKIKEGMIIPFLIFAGVAMGASTFSAALMVMIMKSEGLPTIAGILACGATVLSFVGLKAVSMLMDTIYVQIVYVDGVTAPNIKFK